MQAFLIQLAWKYLLPFVVEQLRKAGAIDAATKFAAMSLIDFINFAKTIKTYHEPEDFPNPPQKPKSTCNLKTREGIQTNE